MTLPVFAAAGVPVTSKRYVFDCVSVAAEKAEARRTIEAALASLETYLAAIRETWDLLSAVMPRDWTSFSIRRVETPSR